VDALTANMLKEGKITSLKVIYIHLRDNRLFPKSNYLSLNNLCLVQAKLLRTLIERIDEKIQTGPSHTTDSYFELLASHKELIELLEETESRKDERLILVQQTFRLVERAGYEVGNLDILRWIISYAWNQGVQLFK